MRNNFSNVRTKAVASDSRKKKQCAMPSFTTSFVAAKKEVFRDILLDLIGINFRICRIFIDPSHLGDVFDVGYVPFKRSPKAAISRRAATGAFVAIM